MNLNHSFKNAATTWWQGIKENRRIYTFGFLSMLLTNGTEVLAPKTLQWMIDALFGVSKPSIGQASDLALRNVWMAASLFVVVALGGLVGRVMWRFTLARMTHIAGKELKCGIWDSIRASSLDRISRFTLGDLMNRSIGDVNSARWIFGFSMVGSCDVLFFTLLGSIAMLFIHVKIALACLATFLIIPPLVVNLAKKEFRAHDEAQAELSTLSENVSQAVRGVRAQRASNSFNIWVDALTSSAQRYAKLRKREQSIAINCYPFCCIPTLLSYGILFLWGPKLVSANEISIGEFAALASYVYLLQGPLAEIGDLVAEWQRGFSSINRITELRNISRHDAKDSVMLSGSYFIHQSPHTESSIAVLEVDNLAIARSGRRVFSGVNLRLDLGQWQGIQGAVGSGKSTLLQALAGLIAIEEGSIKIFGKASIEIPNSKSPFSLKQNVVYAPERPFVFAGSIRHNLALNHQCTDMELWDVLKIVNLDAEVRNFKSGLDSIVGEGGVSLSGGQRQRLALARVVLRASDLVLLDDPLSAVDVYTESKIVSNLRRIWGQKTVVWASNKTSTLHCCDVLTSLTSSGLETESSQLAQNEFELLLPNKTKQGSFASGVSLV